MLALHLKTEFVSIANQLASFLLRMNNISFLNVHCTLTLDRHIRAVFQTSQAICLAYSVAKVGHFWLHSSTAVFARGVLCCNSTPSSPVSPGRLPKCDCLKNSCNSCNSCVNVPVLTVLLCFALLCFLCVFPYMVIY